MKTCPACGEDFAQKYDFCSVDGFPLKEITKHNAFNLTIINDENLAKRLASAVQYGFDQIKQAWPALKRDPLAFGGGLLNELRQLVTRSFRRPHVLPGSLTAIVLVSGLILTVLILEKRLSASRNSADESYEPARVVMMDFHSEAPRPGAGIGATGKGRVGFDDGRGEGSHPTPARTHGGGTGGTGNQNPSSQGGLPTPSQIPAPIPTTYTRLPPAVLAAGIDIDPALWRHLDFASYGDPRSKSNVPSNGPGSGGGIGSHNGTGIGEGNGPGFGRGNNGNMGDGDRSIGSGGRGGAPNGDSDEIDRVYKSADVTTRARVISKPEPKYTEEARRNQITGTVVLNVVFSKSGQVTNIRALQTLPGGLTEKAIAAAREIRFVPATRNGQTVSAYMQLEYNFNLY